MIRAYWVLGFTVLGGSTYLCCSGLASAQAADTVPTLATDAGAPLDGASSAGADATSQAASSGAPPPDAGPEEAGVTPASPNREVALTTGDFVYGPTLTLVRIRAQRTAGLPRDYIPMVETIPSEIGFQVTYKPVSRIWRLKKNDGGNFQLLSAGGMVLFGFDRDPTRSSVSMAATLGAMEDILVLGVGVDLYRGVGLADNQTAPTGLVGWSLSKRGEVTPENVFFTFGVNIASIIAPISSKATGK